MMVHIAHTTASHHGNGAGPSSHSLVTSSFRAALPTWTPKVCRIMAFWAITMGLGLSFYIPLGFR